jgi:glutamate N-acetyltransferase/amino-acid N-acetyltransferase
VRKSRPDLALIACPKGATAAAVFTKNQFQAAPIVLSKASLKKSSGRVRGVVINSGCANAITGAAGMAAAKRVQERAADLLGCPTGEVFVASTGVIGVVLPDQKVRAALPDAIARLSSFGLDAASRAILTTDAGPKTASATCRIGGKRATVAGVAKGAGMIHPNMATMLGFVMTDVAADASFLKTALREAVDVSFNAISVDGDTSTNDTVLLMASGELRNGAMSADDRAAFLAALREVCRELAWMIVRDGEGATRVMEVEVSGARNRKEAALAAHAVATSPLVKTALHSGDPNWGRILAAVGRSGARISTRKVSLRVGPLTLVSNGEPMAYRERDAARHFHRERVSLVVDLGSGTATATLLTSDLGHEYVAINASYRS